MENSLKLLVDWDEFSRNLASALTRCEDLISNLLSVDGEDSFLNISNEFESWKNLTDNLLSDSFNEKRNRYALAFKAAKGVPYSGATVDFKRRKDDLIDTLKSKQRQLQFTHRILSISDAVIKPGEFEGRPKSDYSVDDKIELILNKLYDLYDRFGYPIKDILVGNGINLKRPYEDREFATLMEQEGLIELTGVSGSSARLTLRGARAVENSRKQIPTNYRAVNLSESDLSAKFDSLQIELNKLGLGHEIIFNEINDLRSTYNNDHKKEWIQTLKGKLVDIVLSKAADKDAIKHIFKFITGQDLNLPGLDL